MKKRMYRICLLAGMAMVVGLSGCIVSTSPDTSKVILMKPGETKVFRVYGLNLNTSTTQCRWTIVDKGTYSFVYDTDQIEYTANPEVEESNRVTILCQYSMPVWLPGQGWASIPTQLKVWNICLLGNTAPVWQGDYYITDITDLQALNGYNEIKGFLSIKDSNVKDLKGLESLNTIGSYLEIKENPALTNLSGLEGLASVGGDLNIDTNDKLTSLSGLEGLTSVGGDFNIWLNSDLTNLSGLENLTSIGKDLDIFDNQALISLSALANLSSVGHSLFVVDNPALTILGMTDLQKVGGDFGISSNPLLCKSLVEELMDQVIDGGGIGGSINIEENKICLIP